MYFGKILLCSYPRYIRKDDIVILENSSVKLPANSLKIIFLKKSLYWSNS